jgi:DNA-binding transcriptional LysR family regulator
MRPLPPLTALRAFEAAARHGNFVKAAAELGVTAGAVSQHIKGLEARLGLVLFRRLARGVKLTEAGRAYLPGIAEGFDRLARATMQVHEPGLAGRLTITVLPSFAAGWCGGCRLSARAIRISISSSGRSGRPSICTARMPTSRSATASATFRISKPRT